MQVHVPAIICVLNLRGDMGKAIYGKAATLWLKIWTQRVKIKFTVALIARRGGCNELQP